MHETGTRDYLKGALWVYPTIAIVLALVAGAALSEVHVSSHSWFEHLLFPGTAGDARDLLIGISGTMMTVIALVLGLTLVALQLSSTQFSPRLLRNFLRDRVNQLVLSVFVATFVYATAGLYTVGVSGGKRVDDYPRLAVTLAIVLLFASLIVLIYFVHHVSHSIQVDEVMARVEHTTMRVIEHDLPTEDVVAGAMPEPPAWAVPVPAYRSGYVQAIWPETLLAPASDRDLVVEVVPMVGEHVIAGAPLAWLWRSVQDTAAPDPSAIADAVHHAVRVGYERTAEQDVALGIRQLADIAVRALSTAINDPYTAIQALEHLGVLMSALAPRPLGDVVLHNADGDPRVVVRGRDMSYFVELATGQIRRYGSGEPRVATALLRVLGAVGRCCPEERDRAMVAGHVRLVLAAAGREIVDAADLEPVADRGAAVLRSLEA